jgi:hypothetical protein
MDTIDPVRQTTSPSTGRARAPQKAGRESNASGRPDTAGSQPVSTGRKRKWANEKHLAIAEQINPAPAPEPVAPVQLHPNLLDQRYQLNQLRRATLAPHLWTFATAATGAMGWGLDELFSMISSVDGALAGAIVAASAAATTVVVRYVKREVLRESWRRRYAAAGSVSLVWIVLATFLGVSWPLAAVLALADVAVGAGYWRKLRRRREALTTPPPPAPVEEHEPQPEPEEPPVYEPEPDDGTSAFILNWRHNVARQGKALAGSSLGHVIRIPRGIQGIADLEPGEHTLSDALNKTKQIRSALFLSAETEDDEEPAEELLFDQPSRITLADGTELKLAANQIRVQIIEKSPVRNSPWLERPMFAQGHPGTALIGLYADGNGYAPWTLFDRDGVWSGVVIAGTGMGKSSLFDVLAICARATGVLNVGFIDPQGGASSPILRDNAKSIVALGADQLLLALEALEEMANNREDYLNTHGLSALVPGMKVTCPEGCPCGGVVPNGEVIFIDECDQVFSMKGPDGKALGERFGTLAKRIRKLGIGFICASQHSGIGIFGNSELLRANVATKNYVAFHSASNQTGSLIPGLEINPKTLPKRKGYGVCAGERTRVAPFRAFFAPRRGKDGDLKAPAWAEDLIAAWPEPPLHIIDKVAITDRLPDPKVAAREGQRRSMERLSKLMAGTSVHRGQIPAAVSSGSAEVQVGAVIEIPAPVVLDRPTPSALSLNDLRDLDRTLLDIILSGHIRTSDILTKFCQGEATETQRRKVHASLRGLEKSGWLDGSVYGIWTLEPAGRAAYQQAEENDDESDAAIVA